MKPRTNRCPYCGGNLFVDASPLDSDHDAPLKCLMCGGEPGPHGAPLPLVNGMEARGGHHRVNA